MSTDSSNNASALVLKGDDLAALSDDPDDLAADLQALAGPSAGPNGGSIFVYVMKLVRLFRDGMTYMTLRF